MLFRWKKACARCRRIYRRRKVIYAFWILPKRCRNSQFWKWRMNLTGYTNLIEQTDTTGVQPDTDCSKTVHWLEASSRTIMDFGFRPTGRSEKRIGFQFVSKEHRQTRLVTFLCGQRTRFGLRTEIRPFQNFGGVIPTKIFLLGRTRTFVGFKKF